MHLWDWFTVWPEPVPRAIRGGNILQAATDFCRSTYIYVFSPIPQPSPGQRTVVSEWPCWLQSSVASSSSPCPCPSSSAACRSDPVGTEPRRRDGAGRTGERAVISNPQLPPFSNVKKTPELDEDLPVSGAGRSARTAAASVGWREKRVSGRRSLLPRSSISRRGWTPAWLPTAPSTWPEDSADTRTEGTRGNVAHHRERNMWTQNLNQREKLSLSLSLFVPHTGVRRVCWRPPCRDSTAPSLSSTPTSSCRGSPLPRRPPPRPLRPPPSTSTSPPPPPPPPRPPTQPPTASPTWCRSIPPRRTRPTPTRRCPPTPTRRRHLSTPTLTRHHSGHGSSYVFHSLGSKAVNRRRCRKGDAAGVEAPPVAACLVIFSWILELNTGISPKVLLDCCCCTLQEEVSGGSLDFFQSSESTRKLQVAGQQGNKGSFTVKCDVDEGRVTDRKGLWLFRQLKSLSSDWFFSIVYREEKDAYQPSWPPHSLI